MSQYRTSSPLSAAVNDDNHRSPSSSSAVAIALDERKLLASLPHKIRAQCFNHLTADKLSELESHLKKDIRHDDDNDDQNNNNARNGDKNDGLNSPAEARAAVIAAALLRRIVHSNLSKKKHGGMDDTSAATSANNKNFEEILNSHELPESLLSQLSSRYNDVRGDEANAVISPPTWLGLLRYFQKKSGESKDKLWKLVDSAPWLDYVPVQCSSCGHVIPDESHPNLSDKDVGLQEVMPTEEEHPYVRPGWYRGPRRAVVFEITCTKCGETCRWYRSSDPCAMLNPVKWGRLCGEQEDLRAWFALNLGVSLRRIIPLDWDHVWSEYKGEEGDWMPPFDPSARNFAVRLDEGIGYWSGIVAVGDDVSSCECVTEEYLCATDNNGRADEEHASKMNRYRALVRQAKSDPSGKLCQARTVNGYVIERARFTNGHVTSILQRAASDFGTKNWWEVGDDDVLFVKKDNS